MTTGNDLRHYLIPYRDIHLCSNFFNWLDKIFDL